MESHHIDRSTRKYVFVFSDMEGTGGEGGLRWGWGKHRWTGRACSKR